MSNRGSSSPSPELPPVDNGNGVNEEKSPSQDSTSDGASKSPEPAKTVEGDISEASSSGPSSAKPSTDTQEAEAVQPVATNAHVQGDWQAIWSPQHGMYYFYNMRTNETTWTNPLSPPDTSSAASTSTSIAARHNAEEAAAVAGIDPALAYLDPTLAAGPSAPAAFSYTAKFNARTGAFARADARDPEHVSEYERMKRMNGFYFDMDEWQKDVETRQAEEEETGKKRKKPTKKDLESFKERKKQKKLAKTAWLRT